MEFRDLLEYCRAEAICGVVAQNEISVWRAICRNYSQKFATPLHLCLDGTIDPEQIILAEFEDRLSEFKADDHLEGLLEEIYMLEDPTYESAKRKDLDDFIEQAEREETERLRLGKPIHKAMKDEPTLKDPEEQMPILPPGKSSGSINLSYLDKEEQSQLGGFDES